MLHASHDDTLYPLWVTVAEMALLWAWQVLDWRAAGVLLAVWLILGCVLRLVGLVMLLAMRDEDVARTLTEETPRWARRAYGAWLGLLTVVLMLSGHIAMGLACMWILFARCAAAALLAVARARMQGNGA